MIDFESIIPDEMLAAYIDGNANSFESLKIDSSMSASSDLSELIDIVNDIKGLDLESLPIENLDIELSNLNIEELNRKIK